MWHERTSDPNEAIRSQDACVSAARGDCKANSALHLGGRSSRSHGVGENPWRLWRRRACSRLLVRLRLTRAHELAASWGPGAVVAAMALGRTLGMRLHDERNEHMRVCRRMSRGMCAQYITKLCVVL